MMHLPSWQSLQARAIPYLPFSLFAAPIQTQQIELRSAILSGEITEVEKILRNGADINTEIDSITPLTFAIQNGEEDIAAYLIQAGAKLSLEPLPSLFEERESTNKVQMNTLDGIIVLIIIWVEKSSWDAACASILTSKLWPSFLGPIIKTVSAQTLFGFTMRGLAIDLCSALIWRNFNARIWFRAKSMPIYTVMFLWTRANDRPFDSSGELWWLFQHCFLVGKWILLAVGLGFGQEILYACVNCLYLLHREKRSGSRTPCYGGSQALEAVLSYPGSSHKVASAIIDSKILSREYIKCSIQPAMLSHDPLILRLWMWGLQNGHAQIISSLLELDMPPTLAHPRRNISSIEYSAYYSHISLVECLLAALDPADFSAIEQIDQAFVASTNPDYLRRPNERQKDRLQIQSMLLARIGDVNARDQDKRTALSYAVSGEDLNLVSQLLERGANVNLVDVHGRPPLSYLKNGKDCLSICNKLVSAGADVDHQDNDGNTVMLHQAALSNTTPLRALLDAGADPHKTNRRGQTCLQLAGRYCITDMMQLLIDKGADIEASFLSSTPPLLQACKAHYKISAGLKLLLENRADPNRVDSRGRAPLHNVCWLPSYCEDFSDNSDHLRSIEILIEHGANVNATYTEQKQDRNFDVSVIGVAVKHAADRIGVTKALLAAGASSNGLDEEGKPVIVTACNYSPRADGKSKESDMVQLLLEAGADLQYHDELDRTLLHHASQPNSNNFLALNTLVTRGLDANAKDIYGRTPLHHACQNRYWMTMDSYRTWEAAGMYSGSEQCASWRCSLESTLAIYTLLAHGADTTADDYFKCTPAHIAAKAGNPRIMAMLLLQTGSDLLYEFSDKCERLPFHYAVLSPEVVRLLLRCHSTGEVSSDRYWSVEKQREESLTTLAHKFSNKIWHQISWKRYQKANLNEIVDGVSHPLPWRRGRCNAQDKYGNTPLHYAALAGNVDVVKQYISIPDVDPAVRNNDGETSFDFSLEHRDCAIALRRRLLELGIKVSNSESTPINSNSKSRQAAKSFVNALSISWIYGVFRLKKQ